MLLATKVVLVAIFVNDDQVMTTASIERKGVDCSVVRVKLNGIVHCWIQELEVPKLHQCFWITHVCVSFVKNLDALK